MTLFVFFFSFFLLIYVDIFVKSSQLGSVPTQLSLVACTGQVPNDDWISDDRDGLVFNDCTSAVFAMNIPWHKVTNLRACSGVFP